MEEIIEVLVKVKISYPEKKDRETAIKKAINCAKAVSVSDGSISTKAESAIIIVPNDK